MRFDLDIELLIQRLLPPRLRKEKRVAWIYALLKPTETLHGQFLSFRDKINEDLSYNGQTMILEYLLNKRFNNGGTEIYIENIINVAPPIYVGFLAEPGHQINVGFLDELGHSVFIGNINEYIDSEFDFIVHVPEALEFDIEEMKAVINKYKLSGKRYDIVPY